MVVLLINNVTISFMKFRQELKEILVEVGILQETPFFLDRAPTENHTDKKTRAHSAIFNKQYNHEFSYKLDKN